MCRINGKSLPMFGAMLAIGFVLPAQADNAEPSAGEEQSGALQSRGPLIRWHPASGQMLQPNSEQTAALVAAFRQQMEVRFGDDKGVLAPNANVVPEQLENGMLRVRLPAQLLNFAIVRKPAQGQALDVLPEK